MKSRIKIVLLMIAAAVIVFFIAILAMPRGGSTVASATMEAPVLVSLKDPLASEGMEIVPFGSSQPENHPVSSETDNSVNTQDQPTEVEIEPPSESTDTPNRTNPIEPTQPTQPSATLPTSGRTGECTVTFLGKDAEIIETRTLQIGDNVLPPEPPVYEGYVFQCWDKSTERVQGDITTRAMYWEVIGPTITVDNLYLSRDTKQATVNVCIYNNPGLASLLFKLDYDPVLKLESIQLSEEYGSYITTPEPYTSPQTFSMISPFSPVSSSGVFATLTFSIDSSALPEQLSKVSLNLEMDWDNVFDGDYNEVPFQVNNGSLIFIEE